MPTPQERLLPHLIRVGGGLIYDIRGVGGYHGRTELDLLRGRDQGTCVCAVGGWVPEKGHRVDKGKGEVGEI
jgi:hypothetical protein